MGRGKGRLPSGVSRREERNKGGWIEEETERSSEREGEEGERERGKERLEMGRALFKGKVVESVQVVLLLPAAETISLRYPSTGQ